MAMVRANCEARGVGTRAQIEETCDRAAAQAAAQEHQDALEGDQRRLREQRIQNEERAARETRRKENERREAHEPARTPAEELWPTEDSQVAIDQNARPPTIAHAKAALATCQAHVDNADFNSATDCWNEHSEDWTVLRAAGGQETADRMSADVPSCLASVAAVLTASTACVADPETSDDDLIAKATCLAEYVNLKIGPSCGPLDMKVPMERLARLDIAKAKARVAAKAAPIAAKRAKAAAVRAAMVLPRGWTDVTLEVGALKKLFSAGSCKSDGGYKTCTACRNSALAFPCIQVMFHRDLGPNASFELSQRWTPADAVQELQADWGSPTSALSPPPISAACWDRATRHAALMVRGREAGNFAGTVVLMVTRDGPSMCSP